MWALTVAAVLTAGLFLLAARAASGSSIAEATGVVVICTNRAADGATQAALICLVRGRSAHDVPADATATIPGSTYTHVRDAYAVGGGTAVVDALPGTAAGDHLGYIVIPETVWRRAFASITPTPTVALAEPVHAFGSAGLVELRSGTQTLTPDIAAALIATPTSSSASEATSVRVQLEKTLLAALRTDVINPRTVTTDLSHNGLDKWLRETLPFVSLR